MKTLLVLCSAAVGLAGFAATSANAADATVRTLPAVVHINEEVIIVHHHHHHHRHGHYVWRHHHRVWVSYY